MKQRKMIKRMFAWMLAVTLVLSGINVGAISAKAETATGYAAQEGDLTLYFKLPAGTTAADWGFNVWESKDVTVKDSEEGFTPTGWRDAVVGLKAGEAGFAYVVINGSVTGCQFVTRDAKTEYNCWNTQIAKEGISEAYFDPETEKWYKEAALTTEITVPVLDEIYYIAGDAPFTWDLKSLTDDCKLSETAEGSKIYRIEKTGLAAATYQYKIVQDPEDFGWDYQYVSADTNQWGNAIFTVEDPTDKVTVTLDATGEKKGSDSNRDTRREERV